MPRKKQLSKDDIRVREYDKIRKFGKRVKALGNGLRLFYDKYPMRNAALRLRVIANRAYKDRLRKRGGSADELDLMDLRAIDRFLELAKKIDFGVKAGANEIWQVGHHMSSGNLLFTNSDRDMLLRQLGNAVKNLSKVVHDARAASLYLGKSSRLVDDQQLAKVRKVLNKNIQAADRAADHAGNLRNELRRKLRWTDDELTYF